MAKRAVKRKRTERRRTLATIAQQKTQLSDWELATYVGVTVTTWWRWRRGEAQPELHRSDRLREIIANPKRARARATLKAIEAKFGPLKQLMKDAV